jgi:hypothetical protein
VSGSVTVLGFNFVRRDDPAVVGVWAAHLLDEPMPVAQGDTSLVVFVDQREYASIARRYPSGEVGHDRGHEYVAGALAGVEAAALPGCGDGEHFQFGGVELGTITALKITRS